jgi:hypothetical protein
MEFFDAIDAKHRAFIAAQPVFFVATSAADARINLSPKGMDCLRVLGPNRVAYLDWGGSGNETNAHLLADGCTGMASQSCRRMRHGTASRRTSRSRPASGRSSTSPSIRSRRRAVMQSRT